MPPMRDVTSDFALCQVPDRQPGLELSTAAYRHGALKPAGLMRL